MQERQTNKAHTTEIGSTESWSIAAAGTPSVPAKAQHTHTATLWTSPTDPKQTAIYM